MPRHSTAPRQTRRALLAGAGAALLAPALAAQPFFDPELRVLPGLLVRQGNGFKPLMQVLGPVAPVTGGTYDLPMPDTSIPLFEFPDSLAVFRDYDLDHSRFVSKQEAMLAWVTLMAGIRTGQSLGPGDIRKRVDGGGLSLALHDIHLPRTDRRQVQLLLAETGAGARLLSEMRSFLLMQISMGRGPVWLNGMRQGGMESGARIGR